jgi:DnaJ-class molecular chaperone
VTEPTTKKSAGELMDDFMSGIGPQSEREQSGMVPEVKYSGPDRCSRCRGTGRVIVMMACMPPHVYGDCPVCGGKGVKA